jgi:ParB-like chromosome segregation protein Spo0J
MSETKTNLLDLEVTDWDPADLIPQHGIDRPADLEQIAASMNASGWLGAPLVIDNGLLLTGHHRTEAARSAGLNVPCVEAADLFAAAGVDLDGFRCGWDTDWEQAFYALTGEVRDAYRIDVP